MNVFIDDQPYADPIDAETTLEQLVDAVRSDAVPEDRLVISIQGDGRELVAQELEEALGREVSKFGRLDFLTESTATVAVEALETARQMFAETSEGRSRTTELLTQGHIDEALQFLGPCTSTWQRAFDAVAQVLALTGLGLEDIEADGVPLADMVESWTDQLRQMKEAFEGKDFVLIADLLEYEFGPTTDRWSVFIDSISEQIQEKYAQVH